VGATFGDFLAAAHRHLDLALSHQPDRLSLSTQQARHTLQSLTTLVSTLRSYVTMFGWLQTGNRQSLTAWQVASRDLDQRLRTARSWLVQASDEAGPVDAELERHSLGIAITETARALGLGKDLLTSHWTGAPYDRVALTDLADVINSPPARQRLLDEVAGQATAVAQLAYTLATCTRSRAPGSRAVLSAPARSALSNAALTLDHPWTSLVMAQTASGRSLHALTAVAPAPPPSMRVLPPPGDNMTQLLGVVAEASEHLRQAAYRDGRVGPVRQTSTGLRTTATAMAIAHHLAQGILRQVQPHAVTIAGTTHQDVLGELVTEASRRAAAATSDWITVRETWQQLHTLPPAARADPVSSHAEPLVVHLGRVLHADPHWQPGHGSTHVPRRDPSEIVSNPASLSELLDTLRSVSAAAAALGVDNRATLTALRATGRLITSDRAVISTIATHLHTAPATNRQIDALTRAYERARLTSASCEATLAAAAGLAVPPGLARPLAARLALEGHRSGVDRGRLSPASPAALTAPPGAGAAL
jgi:hypothetical protein